MGKCELITRVWVELNWGSRGGAGQGQSPQKLKTFQLLDAQWKQQICLIRRILLQTGESNFKRDRKILTGLA